MFVGIETSSYSGATLLAFLLNAHPQIASIGEMNGLIPSEDPETYLCSCGKPIKACEFWQSIVREMARRGFDFDVANFQMVFQFPGSRWRQSLRAGAFPIAALNRLRDALLQFLPSERRQFQALVARNLAFIEAVLAETGKCVFVDTSKDHLRARALKMFAAYPVRVVHLVRDPRGVTASRLRRGVPIDAREAARQWVRLHSRLQRLADDHYLRVRYEDLCRHPREVLQQVYAFCGVDPHFEIVNLAATQHHIVGNAMRLENLSAIQLDERWRDRLTAVQQNEIWQIAGKLGAQYGYRR